MVVEYINEESFNSYCTYGSSSQILKVKTCTCSIGKETCPSHSVTDRSSGDGYFRHNTDLKLSDVSLISNSNSFTTETESSVTIIPKHINPQTLVYDELKLSLSSLTSDKPNDDKQKKEKEHAFQRWLAEKNRQRKEEFKKQEEIHNFLICEKEKKVEIERQNFAAWLKTKKEREKLTQKIIQEQKDNEERKLREEKERKQKLAQMKLKLWLKQKEEEILINKMQEQINKIQAEEEKQKRMEESMIAYETWLKNSKSKPKPVPPNRGLESLKTSVSVAFINPTPWVPNVECPKPTTK